MYYGVFGSQYSTTNKTGETGRFIVAIIMQQFKVDVSLHLKSSLNEILWIRVSCANGNIFAMLFVLEIIFDDVLAVISF